MSVTHTSIIAVFLHNAETLFVPITVHVDQASWVMDTCVTTLMSVGMRLTSVMQTHNALTLWDLTNAPAILDSQLMVKFVRMLTNV